MYSKSSTIAKGKISAASDTDTIEDEAREVAMVGEGEEWERWSSTAGEGLPRRPKPILTTSLAG